MKNVNGRFLIHNDKQLDRWKGYLTTILDRIKSGEVTPNMDDITSRYDMRIRTSPQNSSGIIFIINALKGNKAGRLDGLLVECLRAAPTTASTTSWKLGILPVSGWKTILERIKSDRQIVWFLFWISEK